MAAESHRFPLASPLSCPPMNHDAAHKYIYGLPEVAADLLRIVARDWVGELDLATLEDRSSEFLDSRHRKRIGDMVFSARLLRGRLLNGRRPQSPRPSGVSIRSGRDDGEARAGLHGDAPGPRGSERRAEAGGRPAQGAADSRVQRQRPLDGARPAVRLGGRCRRPGWSGPWPRFSRRRTICSLPAAP